MRISGSTYYYSWLMQFLLYLGKWMTKFAEGPCIGLSISTSEYKYSLYVYCLLEDLLYLFRTFTDHSANGKQHPNNITHSAFTSENEERTMSLINKSKPSEGNGKHMPTESALPPVRHFRTGCGEYLKISQTDFCKIAQVHA